MADEGKPEGTTASIIHEGDRAFRTFIGLTPDQGTRLLAVLLTFFAAGGFGYMVFQGNADHKDTISSLVRSYESEAERQRQHCDMREDEARRWMASERERDRAFWAEQNERNRTAINALTSKLDAIVRKGQGD
jgi:hypothetical protein